MQEAEQLCLWAERFHVTLKAKHIAGAANVQADWLSRTTIDHAEWRLHLDLSLELLERFGRPAVDLFATPDNAQLLRYYTRFAVPGMEGVDTLCSTWPWEFLYAFPSLPLLSKVV